MAAPQILQKFLAFVTLAVSGNFVAVSKFCTVVSKWQAVHVKGLHVFVFRCRISQEVLACTSINLMCETDISHLANTWPNPYKRSGVENSSSHLGDDVSCVSKSVRLYAKNFIYCLSTKAAWHTVTSTVHIFLRT